MNKELKIEIFGRVQGVMFRHFVKEKADKLGIKGCVLNDSSGSVLIFVQGDKKILNEFLEEVKKGPKFARVDGVSYFWREVSQKYENFRIVLDKNFVFDQKDSFINLGKNLLNIKSKFPEHVAIIPDGNRRWAKERGLAGAEGHKKAGSYENLKAIFEEARNLGVSYLTFWLFSTDNWKRDSKEIDSLFKLIIRFLKKFERDALKEKIRFRHLGRRDRLPKKLLNVIENLEEETKSFSKFNVQLCLDYGGRDEIMRAMNKVLKSGVKEIVEDDFVNYLDSSDVPDPELIIRTSGERRMSGFMSFQSAYSEFYFIDLHFPDFGPEQLREAIQEFAIRRRRFGGS